MVNRVSLISDIHRRLSARLFTLNKWRKGEGSVLRYLEEFQRTQFESPDVIRQRQLKELRKIVRHATANCPFYTERFAAAGVSSDALHTLEDLTSLPILEKRDIQQNKAELTAANWRRSDLLPNFTGGSTGEPLA